jgi:hypothetical protein
MTVIFQKSVFILPEARSFRRICRSMAGLGEPVCQLGSFLMVLMAALFVGGAFDVRALVW